MRLYLDDTRSAPQGWTLVKNYHKCVQYLAGASVTHLSLDHDLGKEKTGYDVILWIERHVHQFPKYYPPVLMAHSANPVGRKRLLMGIEAIDRAVEARG